MRNFIRNCVLPAYNDVRDWAKVGARFGLGDSQLFSVIYNHNTERVGCTVGGWGGGKGWGDMCRGNKGVMKRGAPRTE